MITKHTTLQNTWIVDEKYEFCAPADATDCGDGSLVQYLEGLAIALDADLHDSKPMDPLLKDMCTAPGWAYAINPAKYDPPPYRFGESDRDFR